MAILSEFFEPLFASGRIIDWILIALVLEAVLLALISRGPRRGLLRTLAPTLVSGALLMLSVRLALVQTWWGWIAAVLALALVSHLIDLWFKLRRT